MADEEPVAELARIIHAHVCDCGEHDPADGDAAEAVLALLAGRGRLTPAGGLTRTEWAVTTPKGKQIHTCYDEAEARTSAIYGRRGVPVSRQVTNWPDGTRLTRPWGTVDGETIDG